MNMQPIFHLQCEVTESRPQGDNYHRLILRSPQIAAAARPGQFLHLAPGLPNESIALLRRPISIYGAGREGLLQDEAVEVVFRLVGPGTRYLAARNLEEKIDCLGPLGNGFLLAPEKFSLLIGGGSGMLPLRWLALQLKARGSQVLILAGAKTPEEFPLELETQPEATRLAELQAVGIETEFAGEDQGLLVTDLLARRLPEILASKKPVQAYAVGPRPMLAALTRLLPPEIPCQVSLEARMACGVGACRSCVTPIRASAPPGYTYKRVCKDGPVFDLREILLEQEAGLG
jgi:dihydroorotate dehydrogenase electron transfer subunit